MLHPDGFIGSVVRSLACACLISASAGAATFRTIYSFTGGSDGGYPLSRLAVGADGVLYGTTSLGGGLQCGNGFGCGTVFSLAPPASPGGVWTETVLWVFGSVGDGTFPAGGLVVGTGGALYGVTSGGGAGQCTDGCGTVFSLSPPALPGGPWAEEVLYSFAGGADGADPVAGVTPGAGGVLYGTTSGGGAAGFGTVYSLVPPAAPAGPWSESVLHSFRGDVDDGASPAQGVAVGPGGVLYGTTAGGGADSNAGTVFALHPPHAGVSTWAEKVIYRFDGRGNHGDGAEVPLTNVVLGEAGVLYGTTGLVATAFSLAPPAQAGGTWAETVLCSSTLLNQPSGGLSLARGAGAMYGTSATGGSSQDCGVYGCGTVWALTAPASPGGAWVLDVLHDFAGADGETPADGVSLSLGVLYGTTAEGGAQGAGTVFELVP